MNSRYLSVNEQYLAPQITPSSGDSVKYPEVTDGKGKVVVAAYPGLEVGQTINCYVKGNGTEFSSIEIKDVQPQYEAALKFNLVFEEASVDTGYFVSDADGNVIGSSAERRYTVLDRP
ncbi:hypothetical protein [Pseudomonas sp.]|uniref:hypothetical protein n=1 Tax=Pseudomonas sp. TaxID=306 RepID=UPI002605248B|nr:hypothetical protein [Pseudomonas sp.]